MYVNQPTPNRHPNTPHKITTDKQRIEKESRERKQRVEYEHRKKEIELIRPKENVRLLNIKYMELENVRGGAKTNLRPNQKQHIDTFYEQQARYMAERAQLYKTKVYNPYQVKQYVESDKVDPTVSATYSNGAAPPGQKDVYVPDESGQHRPALFADRTFHDFSSLRRAPLENLLLNPEACAGAKLQENGFIQEQSTFGASYNTKKFLQGKLFSSF
jgi:hypothetical protein